MEDDEVMCVCCGQQAVSYLRFAPSGNSICQQCSINIRDILLDESSYFDKLPPPKKNLWFEDVVTKLKKPY